jgi:Na+-transporting NADH:ubiquinone oxidoreductase subunit NqrD
VRATPRETGMFYGWIIVGVGIIVTCVGFGAMTSLTVFLHPMADAMG